MHVGIQGSLMTAASLTDEAIISRSFQTILDLIVIDHNRKENDYVE